MEVIKETLWKRCLSTPTKPPAKNNNICLSETAYQHKGTRKKCKKTNQDAIIQWQRQCLMYKPHRKPWPKSKTSDISKQSPSPLHHTFLLGRARFTAQPLSALLGTDSHRTISKRSSECWLLIGHKKCFVLLCPIGEQHLLSSFGEFVHDGYWLDYGLSDSYTKEMHAAVRKLSVWYKLSGIIKILFPRKLKTLFQKYKLELTTGIHAFIDHASVNIRKLKMPWQLTATKTSDEKWIHIFSVSIVIIPTRLLCQMQANSSGTEFLSTISKFIKRNIILSLLVYVLHKT